LNAAHDPFAFRDLILHLAGHAVEKIEMVPSVALRHPDDLPAVGQIVAVLLARIAEEGLRLLADDGARLAGAGVNLDHAIDLMPRWLYSNVNARLSLRHSRRVSS